MFRVVYIALALKGYAVLTALCKQREIVRALWRLLFPDSTGKTPPTPLHLMVRMTIPLGASAFSGFCYYSTPLANEDTTFLSLMADNMFKV